jgi:hypothetical protein
MNHHERLTMDLNLNDPRTIEALAFGIEDAKGYQAKLNSVHNHGVTLKEFRETLNRLHNSLAKLARGTAGTNANVKNVKYYLMMIPEDWRALLDTIDRDFYFSEPWHPDRSRFEGIALALGDMSGDHRKAQAERLRAIAGTVLDDIREPGQGGAKMQARRYMLGIQCLANHFQEAMPGHPVTAKRDSLFYRYVLIWMESAEYAVDQKPTPERHIQNAIDDLGNWKKLCL